MSLKASKCLCFFYPEPSFTVTLEALLNPKMTAEPTELACRVTNITHLPPGGRLGVTWEHTTLPGTFTAAFVKSLLMRFSTELFKEIN